MAAYLILNYDVTDRDRLDAYREAAAPALVGEDRGELVVSTDTTAFLPEGSPQGTHTVMLHFRDRGHACRVYESEEYQAVIDQRFAATVPCFAMIVGDM